MILLFEVPFSFQERSFRSNLDPATSPFSNPAPAFIPLAPQDGISGLGPVAGPSFITPESHTFAVSISGGPVIEQGHDEEYSWNSSLRGGGHGRDSGISTYYRISYKLALALDLDAFSTGGIQGLDDDSIKPNGHRVVQKKYVDFASRDVFIKTGGTREGGSPNQFMSDPPYYAEWNRTRPVEFNLTELSVWPNLNSYPTPNVFDLDENNLPKITGYIPQNDDFVMITGVGRRVSKCEFQINDGGWRDVKNVSPSELRGVWGWNKIEVRINYTAIFWNHGGNGPVDMGVFSAFPLPFPNPAWFPPYPPIPPIVNDLMADAQWVSTPEYIRIHERHFVFARRRPDAVFSIEADPQNETAFENENGEWIYRFRLDASASKSYGSKIQTFRWEIGQATRINGGGYTRNAVNPSTWEFSASVPIQIHESDSPFLELEIPALETDTRFNIFLKVTDENGDFGVIYPELQIPKIERVKTPVVQNAAGQMLRAKFAQGAAIIENEGEEIARFERAKPIFVGAFPTGALLLMLQNSVGVIALRSEDGGSNWEEMAQPFDATYRGHDSEILSGNLVGAIAEKNGFLFFRLSRDGGRNWDNEVSITNQLVGGLFSLRQHMVSGRPTLTIMNGWVRFDSRQLGAPGSWQGIS